MPQEKNNAFLPQNKDYHSLICYKKAVCIYDITYYFAHTYLERGDRTIDQMIQAARSGKQNIVESNIDGNTSTEMEIKLTNVNRASLHELQEDYLDYLRVHGLQLWPPNSRKAIQARRYCRAHTDPADYRDKIPQRTPETICNIAITLLRQTDVLLRGLIDRLKHDFLEQGGIREQMSRARREYRAAQQVQQNNINNWPNQTNPANRTDQPNPANWSNQPNQPNSANPANQPNQPK